MNLPHLLEVIHKRLEFETHFLVAVSIYSSLYIIFILDHVTKAKWLTLIKIFLKMILLINLFIFGCAGSSLLHGLFSSCGEQGLLSSCPARASPCSGFSCRAQASVVVAHGLNNRGFWAP